VLALDLNAEFRKRTAERARAEGVAERVRVLAVTDDALPLEPGSVDRVVCKNVLEYVDDPARTLAEFRRVLRPGGLAHVVDSDWGLLAVEPLGPERGAELFEAARHAYRTPCIGRRLHRLFREACFRDVQLQVLANADVKGHLAAVVLNMVQYARTSGRLPVAKLDAIVAELDEAIASGRYLLLLPQFLVTGAA
jgi:SAM-dependent methyltransferase